MRKVILYIAMSLDGYIADSAGGVEWLERYGGAAGEDGGYEAFVKTVDTVIMGRNTYRQIVTELSPEAWVYEGLMCYVVTHGPGGDRPGLCFADGSPCRLVRGLLAQEGGDIWICGGANVAGQLMEEDLIDVYDISVIPVLLGEGVPLFGGRRGPVGLELVRAEAHGGVMELVYRR